MKMKLNKRGEGTYIDTVVFILVAGIFIAFILNLFSIISATLNSHVTFGAFRKEPRFSRENPLW